MQTIRKTVENNLCVSCGACVAVCPKKCISFSRKKGMYIPEINQDSCISCGMCLKVCAGGNIRHGEIKNTERYLLGDYKNIISAKTNSKDILRASTSGGVVTQLVKQLLQQNIYDSAYLVNGYNYDNLLETLRFEKNQSLESSPKSRYLTVSHEKTIKHMISHPDEKLIIVAVPCAVQGIINVIKLYRLKRENYLIIGLFCDKTMHYGVVDYFKQHPASKGKKLTNFYFRTKEAGGWPGNVRLTYSDGTHTDLPKTERMKVKEYFMPERCLYCFDKLNRLCDIAVGDDYKPENADSAGKNSVIIRTEQGLNIWKLCEKSFSFSQSSPEDIISSQHLRAKRDNLSFSTIKVNNGESSDKKALRKYREALRKLETGKSENLYISVNNDCIKTKRKLRIKKMVAKLLKITGVKH